ncbi:MAG TPA: PstS family phosphate ABC transporter substrate-binding protein [Vicinamibacterales bacterium]|nr:PstS family phosphate ABC transporter substrate-binding protein [Vicinamibacterales bacterium]
MVISSLRRILPIIALTAVACGGGSSGSGGDIRIDGSSTVFVLSEAVAEEFTKSGNPARVTVGQSGTGGGFQKFCRGETDINDASRTIRPPEIEACRANGIEYQEIPVAYDGIAIVVHPQATWIDSITVAELKTLWATEAQRTILRWSQVRPGWPDREIHLYGAGVDSGTYDYFTEAITGKEGASRGDFTASEDDNVLVQGVAGDELALGFLPFAYYNENRERLKLVPVDNGEGGGPVAPSFETIRDNSYSPLSRPLFIYVSEKSRARPEVQQFIDFYVATVGSLAQEVGYVELDKDRQ